MHKKYIFFKLYIFIGLHGKPNAGFKPTMIKHQCDSHGKCLFKKIHLKTSALQLPKSDVLVK